MCRCNKGRGDPSSRVGTERSLVAHLNGVQGVRSSILRVPTIIDSIRRPWRAAFSSRCPGRGDSSRRKLRVGLSRPSPTPVGLRPPSEPLGKAHEAQLLGTVKSLFVFGAALACCL